MSEREPPERKSTVNFSVVGQRPLISEAPPPRPMLSSFSDLAPNEPATEVGRQVVPVKTPSKRDRAVLMVLTGVSAGQVISLVERETVIGRGREAAIRIDDAGLSRKHTRFVHTESGAFLVEDLSSTNGTFIDGARTEGQRELKPGDRVQLGPNVILRFGLVDPTEEDLARQLYEASTRDPLTRAFNRKAFMERLVSEVAFARRCNAHLGVLLMDLDHFKRVNDTHGHITGDVVLCIVAAQIARTIRLDDVFARYGGEEFVILTRGILSDKLVRFGERLRVAVEHLVIPCEGAPLRVTISIGIATLADAGGDAASGEMMLTLADQRLYKAKESGRNCVVSA
jgi:diguanylate cyclase (GGDEF)-like protein